MIRNSTVYSICRESTSMLANLKLSNGRRKREREALNAADGKCRQSHVGGERFCFFFFPPSFFFFFHSGHRYIGTKNGLKDFFFSFLFLFVMSVYSIEEEEKKNKREGLK